ncbi:OprD family outer membrane porin [Sulfurimonas sp. C5]|uniref:OprD family outer membrane porin n=1 Tax=Sulfurimonas sp. C5 TaxID=3036947 RepID=UPI002455F3AD|nr:OprD family outer membrane porin [Sulfurimonas sp. C5]MDH4943512.1 OprD family outer membrane porin [Sulfurimonas sp. C5]
MKKSITLSLIGCGLVAGVNANAAEDLSSMFSEGKASGQIREFSIVRSVSDTRSAKSDYTRKANAVGGYLKFETADFKGLSLGTAFYTTNGFNLDSPKTDYVKVDPSLLGPDNKSISYIGEAYVQYKYENTVFKGGRQKLDTPLAGSDDARMLPNLFEAYLLINKDLPDTTIVAGHVTRFAQGTFGRVYTNGILPITSGYSAVDAHSNVGKFVNMGTYALGEGKDTKGVSVASVTYTGVPNLKVQLWDYYAHDILNAVYGELNYSMPSNSVSPYVGAQFIKEDEVGDKLAGTVNGLYGAAKVGVKVANFNVYAAYSQTSKNSANDASTANAIITPWGGMPAYTQGMVTRHMFLAGTKAAKAAVSYDWKDFGAKLTSAVYYANFDMAANNGYTEGDASEVGFDVIYYPSMIKNLQVRFRGNFTNDFYVNKTNADTTLRGAVEWDEYRFILNYNF